jgi:trk system potassium uptake protein TrkH
MKDARLTPRITETAKGLWVVYAMISLLCVTAYHVAGMNWLDAVIHTFSTMGLGGFSSHDASFGYWNSPAIEAVAIVFMLIAGINFGTHFVAFPAGDARQLRGHCGLSGGEKHLSRLLGSAAFCRV